MRRLCDKYGVQPGNIAQAVDEVKTGKEITLSWEEIERRLDGYFARQG